MCLTRDFHLILCFSPIAEGWRLNTSYGDNWNMFFATMFLHLWKLNKGLNLRFFKGNINSGQALFRCAVVSSWLPQLRQLLLLGYFSLLFFLRWIKTAMTSFQFLYNYQWYSFVINNTACVVRPTTANSSLKCYLNWGLIWTLTFADSHRSINFTPNDCVLFF